MAEQRKFRQVDKLTALSINTYRTKGSKNTTSDKMVFDERSSDNIKEKSEKTGSNTKQDIKSKMYETDKKGNQYAKLQKPKENQKKTKKSTSKNRNESDQKQTNPDTNQTPHYWISQVKKTPLPYSQIQ